MISSKQNNTRLQSIPSWILIFFILAGPLLPTADESYICQLNMSNSTSESECRTHDECGDLEPVDNDDIFIFHFRRNIDENYIPCNCIEYERIHFWSQNLQFIYQIEDLPTYDSHIFLDCIVLQI